jgi:uncharacterized protein YndB with AHSA1/START domain
VIAAPPDRVFPWLVGSEPRLRWMGALVESEPLTDGPPEAGSRFRDVFEDHGRRIELEAELAQVDPPRSLVVDLVADAFEASISQQLEEEGVATHLTTVIETTYTGLAARLVAGLVSRHAQQQLEEDLDRLRRLVEGGAADESL